MLCTWDTYTHEKQINSAKREHVSYQVGVETTQQFENHIKQKMTKVWEGEEKNSTHHTQWVTENNCIVLYKKILYQESYHSLLLHHKEMTYDLENVKSTITT